LELRWADLAGLGVNHRQIDRALTVTLKTAIRWNPRHFGGVETTE
jgi:hypothetical protein